MLLNRKVRRGTVLAEAAFVYPVLFLVLFAIILLSILVFRYQQVTHCAREGSRWASVHGEVWAKEMTASGTPTVANTPQDVYAGGIAPYAVAMKDGLTYTVTWNTDANGNPLKKPTRTVVRLDPVSGLQETVSVSNTVTVSVTYTWNTGLFGTIPVTSTSVNIISY
jgi:Flp pilus assembly protein TadG